MLRKKTQTKSRSMIETGWARPGSNFHVIAADQIRSVTARCKKESSDRVALAEMQKKGGVK